MRFVLKADASNAFNNHYFVCDGTAFGDCNAFNNDLGNSNFGVWNNTVSQPRSIQLIGRFEF
jgi:hypothetical protein